MKALIISLYSIIILFIIGLTVGGCSNNESRVIESNGHIIPFDSTGFDYKKIGAIKTGGNDVGVYYFMYKSRGYILLNKEGENITVINQ